MTLREFASALEGKGLLERVDREVSWKHEIGRLTRQAGHALLFERIADYPGWRLLTNGLKSYPQIALALGLAPDSSYRRIAETMRQRIAAPIAPVLLENGLAAESLITESIDLQALPIPVWSEIDVARYVGTWHLNLTKDPQTGQRNVGVYRMQLLGADRTTVSVSPRSHLAAHMRRAEAMGLDLEMAVAIGVGEPLVMAAGAAPPADIDELALAGALQGQAVSLARCRTVSLEVPADAEVVLEGRLQAGARVQDGPYLDYAGILSTNPRAYLFKVTAVAHRRQPIFRGTSVGEPGGEDHMMFSLLARLGLVDFHGSRARQWAQNWLLSSRRFRAFQLSGRVGTFLRKMR